MLSRPPCASLQSFLVEPRDVCVPVISVRHSSIHGFGVFAEENIAAGTFICEYKGEIISAEEAEKRAALRERENRSAPIYLFEIDEKNCIDATDTKTENPARFINHSCDENCDAIWNAKARRLEIFAKRDIRTGEELSLDYGFGLAGFFEHPCRCGAKNCIGFIVAKPLRTALLRRLARKNKTSAKKIDFSK